MAHAIRYSLSGAATLTIGETFGIAGHYMIASVSGKRTASAGERQSTAAKFAGVEVRSMTKLLLIEDDAETAEEITAELAD